jgi:hypothetical protein
MPAHGSRCRQAGALLRCAQLERGHVLCRGAAGAALPAHVAERHRHAACGAIGPPRWLGAEALLRLVAQHGALLPREAPGAGVQSGMGRMLGGALPLAGPQTTVLPMRAFACCSGNMHTCTDRLLLAGCPQNGAGRLQSGSQDSALGQLERSCSGKLQRTLSALSDTSQRGSRRQLERNLSGASRTVQALRRTGGSIHLERTLSGASDASQALQQHLRSGQLGRTKSGLVVASPGLAKSARSSSAGLQRSRAQVHAQRKLAVKVVVAWHAAAAQERAYMEGNQVG